MVVKTKSKKLAKKKPMAKKGKIMTRTKKRIVAKKIAKKVTRKLVRKTAKKVIARKTQKAPVAKAKKMPTMGTVVHYYDRIGVAVVELNAPVKVGDWVRFQHGTKEFKQRVGSLQIEHEGVSSGAKGQVLGMKVDQPADRGWEMMPA